MTRLSEALERARVIPPEPQNASGNAGAEVAVREDVPRTWRFNTEEAPSESSALDSGRAPIQPVEADPMTYRFGVHATDKVVIGPNPDHTHVEQFRRLAAVLHHAQLQNGVRSVMITSAVPSEGKTLTSCNLALTLSQSYGRRVLLIDADLRRPGVHEVFRLPNHVGLGETLKHADGGRPPVQKVMPKLWILTAGRPDSDPMSLLVSDAMRQLLADSSEQFDWVLIDTPPVGLLPDANLLADMINTALIVVSANSTPYQLVKRAVELIGVSRILGVVFNRVHRSELANNNPYYGSYYYGHPKDAPRKFNLFGKKRS